MTKIELLSFIRTLSNDKVLPYLATDAEILNFISEAEKEAAERALYLRTDSSFNMRVLSGKALVCIDSAIIFIDRLKLQGKSSVLIKTSKAELDFEVNDWESRTGTPTHYYQTGHEITLYPKPDAAFVLQIDASRRPIEDMETPEHRHEDLAYWCLYRIYSIPDSDLLDLGKSAENLKKFDAIFGHKRNESFNKMWQDMPKEPAFMRSPF